MKNNVHIKINKVNTNIKMCLHHALCFWLGHTDGYSNHAIRINVLFYWWEDGRKSWKQCIIIQFTKRVIHSFRRPLGKAVPGRRWSGFRSAAGAVRCRRAVRDPGWTYGLRCSGDRRAYRQNFCRSCRRVRRNRLPHRDNRRRWGSGRAHRGWQVRFNGIIQPIRHWIRSKRKSTLHHWNRILEIFYWLELIMIKRLKSMNAW